MVRLKGIRLRGKDNNQNKSIKKIIRHFFHNHAG